MPASSSRERKKKIRNRDFNHSGVVRKAKRNTQSKPRFDTRNEAPTVQGELSRKKFHPQDLASLQPKNVRQEEFLCLFYDGVELIVSAGSSGVGKTHLALHSALSEVLREDTPYDKVVLVRSAVQTRDIGHLPGGLGEDKSQVYEMPYHGLCRNILPAFKEGYTHLKSLGYVEFHLTSFLRGETFDRSIILVEEFQSMSYHELKTVVERAGLYSRIILCGDTRQDDLAAKGKKSDQSGYGHFMNVISKMKPSMVGVVEFQPEDVVRSGLAREFIIADYNTA